MRHVLLATLVLLLAGAVEAREGAYRGPSAQVPPGLREPSDPAPPPPPPPVAVTPRRAVPTSPVPLAPPAPPPARTTEPPVVGIPVRTVTSFEDWRFWYHHEKDALEWRPGRIAPEGESAATFERLEQVLAASIRDVERDHPAVVSAALLAWARTVRDPAAVSRLLAIAERKDLHQVVQESALLALGLLRRSEGRRFLDTATYDGLRQALFAALETSQRADRTRAFAAFALGLLGDQPTADASSTTARLFAFLRESHPNVDLDLGALRAIALQPPASVTEEQRGLLRVLVLKGEVDGGRRNAVVRSHAALTLGEQGTGLDAGTLWSVLTPRRGVEANLRRSAAIALGRRGARLGGATRAEALAALLRVPDEEKDDTTRHFALMALVEALGENEALEAGLGETLVGESLLLRAALGTPHERPWAALALGRLAGRLAGNERSETTRAFRAKTVVVLGRGLADVTLDPTVRAAFAVALGLANDHTSAETLRDLAADRTQDKVLRAYAVQALALMDRPADDAREVMRAALLERSNATLTRQAACSLGLAGDAGAIEALAAEAGGPAASGAKAEAAAALAKIGPGDAVAALLALATNPEADAFTRAVAFAALGRTADGEPVPSLFLLTHGLNYRASTNAISALFAIL